MENKSVKLNKLTNNNIFKDVRIVVRCSCHGGTKNKENCVTSVEKYIQVIQADRCYPLKICKIKQTDYKQNVGYNKARVNLHFPNWSNAQILMDEHCFNILMITH